MKRGGALALLVGAAVALSGCSQLAALAPVGGDAIAEVRYGAIDVLLARNIDLLDAPTCTAAVDGVTVTCSGSTLDGRSIEVVSSTADDAQLDVTVGGSAVYSGPLADVIDAAARG